MKFVKTNMGLMPLNDYLDIKAMQCGYDDYAALRADGLNISVSPDDIVEEV